MQVRTRTWSDVCQWPGNAQRFVQALVYHFEGLKARLYVQSDGTAPSALAQADVHRVLERAGAHRDE